MATATREKSKVLAYTVRLEPEEGGSYSVSVPALPGCLTWGETYSQALDRAREAIEGHLLALRQLGKPIPRETSPRATAFHVLVEVTTPAAT